MPAQNSVPDALVVSGDARIEKILAREDTHVIHAFACRMDGFVNDTFTEYANASVYRPASVCRARLVSTIQDTVRFRGRYYLGFTMYTTAGQEEPIEVWIGHRRVAQAVVFDPDNRVHLFVVPEAFRFQGGETIRLVTSETTGPCRIENLIFLPRCPKPDEPALKIQVPHVDLRHTEDGIRASITWITNRPASGDFRYGTGKRLTRVRRVDGPLMNHEVVLEGLRSGQVCGYEICLRDQTSRLDAVYTGEFRADIAPPESRVKRARLPILLRRGSAVLWPVSVGVPFPKGALGGEEQIRLLESGRNEVPVQARTLTRWEDGSVRWALLDFLADGQREYVAEYGSGVPRVEPDTPLLVEQARKGITVTTGPIRVVFSRDAVHLPGIVFVRQADDTYVRLTPEDAAPVVCLVDASGKEYVSGKPESVTLEESGPERVCVRIDLAHGSGKDALFRSTFRVHLFRDRALVRVQHTFENDCVEEEFTSVRSFSLRADVDAGEVSTGRVGRRKVDLGKPTVLRQEHDNRFTVQQGRKVLSRGRRAEGVAGLNGETAGVALAVRDFWQNYPKGLAVDEKGFTLQLCPLLKKDAYPRGGELEDRLYYSLLDGRYKLKRGVARTHEFWFHFSADGVLPGGFSESVQNPPLYSVSLEMFNKSRAVTQLPSKEVSPFPPYEKWVEAAREAYAKDREASRAYGMLNFGDWFGERVYNWGNLEYDASWCFLQEYLRGGHSDFYDWAEQAAHHLADVDTCHHSLDAGEVGAQYLHSVGHTGGYYPDGYRESAIFTGRSSVSHTWVEGPFLYGLLAGDSRILEITMRTSDRLVGGMLNYYDFTNCRNSGWHLIHLSAAYKTTGRRVYLNAARIIVDRVLERQRSSGGWDRLMVPGHCHCDPPRHTGNAGFMVGILMVGLKRYHEATGEKRVADAIVRAADFCIDSMWVEENRAFHYTSCPKSSIGGGADMRILKGVAAAYRFSGKERFREVLAAGVQSAMAGRLPTAHRGVGKSICSPMRGALQVLVDLPGPTKER